MIKNMKRNMLLTLLSAFTLVGCYNDKADELYPQTATTVCDTANISFSAAVKPIFEARCNTSACHDAAGVGGGYNFTNYAGISVAVTNNRLSGSINHLTGFSAMPKGLPKLTTCEINKIDAWIHQGALDN